MHQALIGSSAACEMPDVLAHVADVAGRGDAKRLRGEAHGLPGDGAEIAVGDFQAWSSEPLALGASATEPCLHALHDEAAIKLGNGGDDCLDGGPEWRASVDLLAE